MEKTVLDEIIKIMDPPYEIHPYSSKFYRTKGMCIEITEDFSQELFQKILKKLTDTFENPVYVHSYWNSGFVWRIHDTWVEYKIEEVSYQVEQLKIYLSHKCPAGWKIPYETYRQINEQVHQVFENFSLVSNESISYINKRFCYLAENSFKQYVFFIKSKRMELYVADKIPLEQGQIKIHPKSNQKYRIGYLDMECMRETLEKFIKEWNAQ